MLSKNSTRMSKKKKMRRRNKNFMDIEKIENQNVSDVTLISFNQHFLETEKNRMVIYMYVCMFLCFYCFYCFILLYIIILYIILYTSNTLFVLERRETEKTGLKPHRYRKKMFLVVFGV